MRLATKKIAAGFYSFEYRGVTVLITKVEGQNFWYFEIERNGRISRDESGQDWFGSKSIATTAARILIDSKETI